MGSLKYWALICEESNGASQLQTIGHSFGVNLPLGSSYWALIWESVMGVQAIGPSFGRV